jgi:prefoldin subunit 5
MKLTAKTIDTINKRLEKVKKFIAENNGANLENIKDELYEIVQQMEEETHRCYNEKDA